ncbi:NAD(P)H-dependent flavin oxidoreductase [Clostridium tepidum]|jgi:NAD(P)H-dependent flavin oxidoreductase YrpB (nitropropane dioxygenase family)|uniref:Probable nitronate monooxygenase n=1 Tax=Clostridium tepidum TaxID=1962263 RepID=A0A1S9IGJ2_9CLOT|nr:nitronate monooxygenase [Clostridium tepidum]MCR1934920.1 nitronate monooxygenase [Clostridium tepidum]MDU6878725.1 nitronate monooxygenase [Clostridium botulinum]OOO61829.1 2-nitropropane dioxygenase [Clostridium tepidum]OOO69449.1 2-nitropropane dioxygenase [Clostridium tepidum]
MGFKPLKIGNLISNIPIIQGGMGIGISGYNLASAVANAGAIGIISAAQIGYREKDFKTNTKEANIRALRKEIRKARNLSPEGIIGVNIMVAMNNYEELVNVCLEENIDIIISGAGLPLKLPQYTKNTNIKIAPIVSSKKATTIIIKQWIKKYDKLPDLIIVEGPLAGGHLGFKYDDLNNKDMSLDNILKDVLKEVKIYEDKFQTNIPVIAAGGIYEGKDIKKFLELGASGVQMATRFIATKECDAHINFKKAFINCREQDIKIINSPVGLPGRAINNNFVNKVCNGRINPEFCFKCLKNCNPKETPYCISKALIEAVKGNLEEGLIFTGINGYKINKITTVQDLIRELMENI